VPFRKNPQGTIEAFKQAFRPDEPVRLIIKVLNGSRDSALLSALEEQSAGSRVTIWNATLDSADRFRLLASVDALVSLHRSEGFGLSIAEAMAYGLPVVVTNWSGNVDFTNADNAALVDYDLERSDVPHGPYPAGTVWAEPRLDDAARKMRRVWTDEAWRRKLGSAGARTIAENFSYDVVGRTMKARLDRLTTLALTGPRNRAYDRSTPSTALPIAIALQLVATDAWRRPLFYASRISRMPRLLMTEGSSRLLHRIASSARDHHPDKATRSRFLLRRLFQRMRLLFGKRNAEPSSRSDALAIAGARKKPESD
jgi:hypothetical protein